MAENGTFLTIAGISDTHFGEGGLTTISPEEYKEHVRDMSSQADIIIHCGDFTNRADVQGARAAASVFRESSVPVVGVLGNHDFDPNDVTKIPNILHHDGGIRILNGEVFTMRKNGKKISVVGSSGYSSGHHKLNGTMRKLVGEEAFENLERSGKTAFSAALRSLRGTNNVAIFHFHPIKTNGNGHEQSGNGNGDNRSDAEKEFGDLILQRGDKIRLILHGHIHSTEIHPRNALHEVDTINIASTISVAMTPGVPYRLIRLKL